MTGKITLGRGYLSEIPPEEEPCGECGGSGMVEFWIGIREAGSKLERPRGGRRLGLLLLNAAICALYRVTPVQWMLRFDSSLRCRWATWVYARHWAVGERLEGRL